MPYRRVCDLDLDWKEYGKKGYRVHYKLFLTPKGLSVKRFASKIGKNFKKNPNVHLKIYSLKSNDRQLFKLSLTKNADVILRKANVKSTANSDQSLSLDMEQLSLNGTMQNTNSNVKITQYQMQCNDENTGDRTTETLRKRVNNDNPLTYIFEENNDYGKRQKLL